MLTGPSSRAGIALGSSHGQTSDGARHGARRGGTAAATQTCAGASRRCARHACPPRPASVALTSRSASSSRSSPKHVSNGEVGAFFDRVRLVRPDLTLFVVDTALCLSDKVVPMFTDELARRSETRPTPCRVERELWALGRHLYVVDSRPDLMTNIGRAIAEGLPAQHPQLV